MIKTIKAAIIVLCLLISASAFSQDTLPIFYGKALIHVVDTSWFKTEKETVDVIALVSDTSVENNGVPLTYSTKCRAFRTRVAGSYSYSPLEYILPKKLIVWQSVIINNKTK